MTYIKDCQCPYMSTANVDDVGRQELQVALDGNKVDYHRTWISLAHPEERMEVTQIYRKVDGHVLCCIIPWDVASSRSGNSRIYCMRTQCIMLWPDRSVDVYNSMDMRCQGHVGSVGDAFKDVWDELWTYYGLRHIKDAHEKNMEDLGAHPATAEDIFADVRDLVDKVRDGDERKRLSALIEQKKREFDREYDDCRYRQNGQKAYGVIGDFVKTIKSALNADDQESMKVADFLIEFCFEMQIMLQSFGDPKLSFEQRIQERLKSYYTTAPMALKLAKLKRLA